MTPPTRPQHHLVDDGFLVEPEPVEPPLSPAAKGCVWSSLLAACLVFWALVALFASSFFVPATGSAPDPTASQPGASATLGSVGVAALVQASASSPELSPTPEPAGEIGTALVGGWATWCAPTPTQCQAWGGDALLAAMPSFAGNPVQARVCVDGSRCVVVTVVSSCGCGERHGRPTVIDLSSWAFRQLAPLGHGVVAVTVEWPLEGAP